MLGNYRFRYNPVQLRKNICAMAIVIVEGVVINQKLKLDISRIENISIFKKVLPMFLFWFIFYIFYKMKDSIRFRKLETKSVELQKFFQI